MRLVRLPRSRRPSVISAGACPGATDPFMRWTYDKVGNRLTSQRPDLSLTYNYNALDQVTSIGFAPWTYDQNGTTPPAGTRRTPTTRRTA